MEMVANGTVAEARQQTREIKALRADLEAVAVMLNAVRRSRCYDSDFRADCESGLTRGINKALARPCVKEILEGAKDES